MQKKAPSELEGAFFNLFIVFLTQWSSQSSRVPV